MGKVAIITGADGGMGRELTRAVAVAGYDVVMLCHSAERGEKCREQLAKETGNNALEVRGVDLSLHSEVHRVAHQLLAEGRPIALLMNNAGIMSREGRVMTAEGVERTVAVNYLAPFLLTTSLLPLMSRGTRIVNMVSLTYALGRITPSLFTTGGGTGTFWRIPVYSNTKLALWLFTRRLAQHLYGRGITVNAADPGIVDTKFIHLDLWFDPLTDLFFRPCIHTPAQGAATAISLLLDEKWEGITGRMCVAGKQRLLAKKYLHHPQMEQLWEDTIAFLRQTTTASV